MEEKYYYYENYQVIFTPDFTMSAFIDENNLKADEIVQMFQEDKDSEGNYQYLIIFKRHKP